MSDPTTDLPGSALPSPLAPPSTAPAGRRTLRTFAAVGVVGADGVEQPLPARALAILARLAVAGERGVARESLIALLWPERPTASARHAFAQTLYAARRVLGADVVVGTDVLRLNPAAVIADVAELERALAAGDREEALARYAGPFLDGFHVSDAPEFDHWAAAERDRIARLAAGAADALAAAAERAGDPHAVAAWRRRRSAMDPLDPGATAALMRALVAVADVPGAIRAGERHATLVREVLDAAPSAAVLALLADVRGGRVAPPAASTANGAAPSGVAPNGVAPSGASSDDPSADRSGAGVAPPVPPPVVPPRPRRGARALTRLGILVAVAASIGALAIDLPAPGRTAGGSADPGAAGAATVAVMPFRVGGADSSLAYLGEGMLDLLTISLGSGAAPRAVDARAVLRALPDDPRLAASLPVDSLGAVARRLGAGRFVVGEVIGRPDRLTLHAALVDVDARGSARPRVEASVQGPADSVPALAERLLVRLLLRAAPEPEARGALLAAEPVDAVRLYLTASSAYRGGQFVRAAADFARALEIDSGFAYAALGLANAAGWTGDRAAARRAFRLATANRARLTPADRVYLSALAGPRFPVYAPYADRIAAWDAVTRTSPERPDAWYELGDQYFHAGRFIDAPADADARAEEAFSRAAALDSGFLPALEHLVLLAARRGDTPAARRAFDAFARRDSTSETALFLRWRVARLRDPAAGGAPAAAAPFAADSLPFLALRWVVEHAPDDVLPLGPPAMRDAAAAAAALSRRAATPAERVEAARARHSLALNLGRPAEALRWVDSLHAAGAPEWIPLRLPVLAALYEDGDRAAAERAAAELARRLRLPAAGARGAARVPAADAPDDEEVPQRERMQAACVLGQWTSRDGAQGAAATDAVVAREIAAAAEVPALADEARACRLLLAARRPDPRQPAGGASARAALDSLDTMLALGVDVRRMYPYVALAVAAEYRRLGETARALRSAGRYVYLTRWPYYLGAQTRLEAELALAAGDTARAACALAQHVALRDAPEPALRPAVESSRALLRRIARGKC